MLPRWNAAIWMAPTGPGWWITRRNSPQQWLWTWWRSLCTGLTPTWITLKWWITMAKTDMQSSRGVKWVSSLSVGTWSLATSLDAFVWTVGMAVIGKCLTFTIYPFVGQLTNTFGGLLKHIGGLDKLPFVDWHYISRIDQLNQNAHQCIASFLKGRSFSLISNINTNVSFCTVAERFNNYSVAWIFLENWSLTIVVEWDNVRWRRYK